MMKTRKLLCMILVAATISCFSSMPSFALSATASNASLATSSNAWPMDDYVEFDGFDTLERPMLMMSSDDEITNTVDFTNSQFSLFYYDMSGNTKWVTVYLDKNGYASISRPSDFVSSIAIELRLFSANLPSPGKYTINAHFGSNTGGFTYTSAYIYSRKLINNADYQESQKDVDFLQSSGDLAITTSVDLNNVNYMTVSARTTGIIPPVGGYWKVQFTKLSSNSSVDVGTAGGSYTPEDAASDTALNTSKMADTLEEIAQTISNQLEALWNQMFNLMHVPQLANDDKNTGLITGAIEEQVEADRQNTEDIIAAEESNTTTIINNNNENTEKITNGYDNSALNAENDKLNNSLTEYDNAEKQVMDKVNHALDDINFNQSLDNYMQPILLCSTFMQRLYDNSGGFKDVINLTLIVSIASIVVGIYRFKGGD